MVTDQETNKGVFLHLADQIEMLARYPDDIGTSKRVSLWIVGGTQDYWVRILCRYK